MRQNPDLILREIYGKNILMPIRYNEAKRAAFMQRIKVNQNGRYLKQ